MSHKSRKQKASIYQEKFGDIPTDFRERIDWMLQKYHVSEKTMGEIVQAQSRLLGELSYYDFNFVLYEQPEGTPRPRFRIVNRSNLVNFAMENSQFVHVYSISGAEDSKFMRRLLDDEVIELQKFICTACNIEICAYFKTPSCYSTVDTFLAELGIERPLVDPDFDNIIKKYCDMLNVNVWLDDKLVVDGALHKYYSVLPRVEVRIKYLNMLYNKYQYNAMLKSRHFNGSPEDLRYFQR